MPTINKPFLLKLLLVVAALAGLLCGAHTLQARRIPEALHQQAERATDAGKTDAAIHYLRQYLEFAPEDVDAHVQLAELLKARDKSYRGYTELLFLYDKILGLDPGQDAVRRDALAAALKMARHSDAVTYAEALLERFPTDAELWQQLGAAQAGLNQLAEARKSYEAAVKHAPGEMLGYHRLAQLLWKSLNQPAEAKAVLDRMVAALPQEPQAYYARARFEAFVAEEEANRGRAVNLGPATHDLRRALELDPENADAALLLAEILQKGRDVPAAHAILRDAASLYPRDVRLVRSLAWLELVRGNLPAAMAVLEEGLKHSPDGFDMLVPLADLLVQQGDTARTADILTRLRDRRAPAMQVKYLQARVAMRDEKWAEAATQLEALRADTLKLPGLETQLNLLLAACAEKTGDADAREKAFKRVTAADPGNVTARVGLASLYLDQGRFDEAVREYETAARSQYAPGSVIAQWVRQQACLLKRGGSAAEWRKLEQAAASAVGRFGPVSSEPVILRADVAAAEGKYNDAIQLLRQETGRRPGDTRLWAALAEVSADALGTPAGLAIIDEAQAAAGDGPDIRLARARLYAREPGRVRPIDPLAEHTDTWAEADQMRLLFGLVEVYDLVGDRAKVVQTVRHIAAHRPTDASLWLRLHERALEAGNAAVAAEARAALAKIEGESGPGVAVCDTRVNRDAASAGRLVAACSAAPNRADACLALAAVRAKAGDAAEAARLTERAFVLEPTRYESARAWLVYLCQTGATDRAAKLVAQLAADSRWAGEPFRRLMAGVIERVPPAVGATVVTWCKPLVERDPGGLRWLAQCSAAVGKANEAEALLTTATQAAPPSADDWLDLAIHQAASGRKDAADQTLTRSRERLSPALFFSIAAAFRETPAGKGWAPKTDTPAEKRHFAQACLALKLSRSERAEAAKVLEQFLAEKDLPPPDAGWASRNLAMLYAISGTPEERGRAMKLLRDVSETPASPDDLRATAGVLTTLARYLEGEDRKLVLRHAAAALESVYAAKKSPRDLYNLAQVHRVAGNRADGRKCLNQLLASDPKNLYYLVSALEELTEDGNFPAAESFAARVRSLYPGEFRAVTAVARYECKAGRPDRALALAEQYAAAADSGAGDYLARSARVAELLDELVRYATVRNTPVARRMTAAAVERYEALVPTRPEAVVAVAGLLAAEGRVPDAFAKIDQYGRYMPVRVRAAAGLAALRSGGATEQQFATVRVWLSEASAKESGSIALQLNEAEFLALQQDYAKSAEAYRAILRQDPRHVVALNNLAWILAADPGTAQEALEVIGRAVREAGLTGELLDTRARIRITLKQFAEAERDLTEALTQEQTALRWFHMAVLRMSQSPPRKDEAVKAFRDAKARGLDPKIVHPADLPLYRVLEAEDQRAAK
jgi:tetratricopeptide (TPR) repeat protein